MGRTIALTILLVTFLLGGVALADTLYLKNGKKFQGSVVSDSGGVVKFKTSYGVLEFPKDKVDRIEKGASPADEYKKLRAELEDEDIEGLLGLARWCREQKLFSHRKKLLRSILKTCPEHPGARKESGQAWKGGKWVKAKNVESPEVKPGKATEIKETRGKVAVPSGWKRKDAAKSVTGTGPDNYATAPVIRIEIIAKADPAKAFPEKDGWAKPTEVKAAEMTGLTSRRDYVENLIGKVVWMAVLSAGEHSVRIKLSCLECESEDYGAAMGVAIDSLEFSAPPADYVGKYFQLNLPKPKDSWHQGETDDGDLVLTHNPGDAIEYGHLLIMTGAPGEKADAVQMLHDLLVGLMKSTGDIEKEEEITISGEKASFIQGTFLQGGVPYRGAAYLVKHKDRTYMIRFQNHEFGADKTGHALKTVLDSFRFIK